MSISNSQIRKLGKRIREVDGDRQKCTEDDIRLLQAYRLEHKDSLIHVFDVVSKVSKKVHNGRMVAFRLKKIDTILSKLRRSQSQSEGKMELDRMWDVAGCRVIVQSEKAIYEIISQLSEEFEVKRPRDYIKSPAEDGYRGYHLYIKPKRVNNAKVVEVQLRTIHHHLWATLVEVIDVVYDTKIKEGDKSLPELNEFLKIYSNWEEASIEEKKRSLRYEKQHDLYSNLSAVFTDNIMDLRLDWINLRDYGESEPYILFNVDQNTKKVTFRTFKTIEEAEDHYLNDFIHQDGDFMVARLDVKYFVQLAFVYANYVLSNHRFLDGWLGDLLNLIKDKKVGTKFVLNEIKPRTKVYKREVKKIQENEAEIIRFFEARSIDDDIVVQLKKWKEERDGDLKYRTEILEKIDKEIDNHKKRQEEQTQDLVLKLLAAVLIIGIVFFIVNRFRKK